MVGIIKEASDPPNPFDLPDAETLDAVVRLVLFDEDATFARLATPEQRIQIIKIAQEAERVEVLRDIEADLDELRQWFKVSRPYEGQ